MDGILVYNSCFLKLQVGYNKDGYIVSHIPFCCNAGRIVKHGRVNAICFHSYINLFPKNE